MVTGVSSVLADVKVTTPWPHSSTSSGNIWQTQTTGWPLSRGFVSKLIHSSPAAIPKTLPGTLKNKGQKRRKSDTVGIGKMIQRNQYMSGICGCHNHSEMMGQALCFSFCCLCHKHVCVFDGGLECVVCHVSSVSRRVCRVYVWVLCLDWVVIVFQTCGIFTAEWFTPTSICCLPPQSVRGLINNIQLTCLKLNGHDWTFQRNTRGNRVKLRGMNQHSYNS